MVDWSSSRSNRLDLHRRQEVLQRHGFPEEIMIFTGKFNGETALRSKHRVLERGEWQ